MKVTKIVICVISALAVFLTAGCTKKESDEKTAETSVTKAGATEAAFGYTMRVGMWLYTIERDTGSENDVTKAIESLPLAEKLQLLTPEPRKALNSYDSKIYDYYHVRRDTGSEGFVFANQLTVNSVLAVAIDEKANLYRSPKNVDASDYILSRKTILGTFPETEKDGFIQIEAYDPERKAYRRNLFIKTSAISYHDADVRSSVLLQIAEAVDPVKEANRREALLDSAVKDYPESIFANEIRVLVEVAAIPVETINITFRVVDDDVNVRENPNVSSRVVMQLAHGTEVKAVETTVEMFNIDGQTAQWFHITQPVDGWVFGSWLIAIDGNTEDGE